jgi:nucleoside 2-deoxyribosyltransferase
VRAFISAKYHPDLRNRPLIEHIAAALDSQGCQTHCIVRDVEQWGQVRLDARELMRLTFAGIDSCDLLVVDLTEKGVGIGIEAGYAAARGIPILTLAPRHANLSQTLAGISDKIIGYDDAGELAERLAGYLDGHKRR